MITRGETGSESATPSFKDTIPAPAPEPSRSPLNPAVMETKNYLSSNIFPDLIAMFHETSIPATMKAMAHGRMRVRLEELRSSLLPRLTACRVSRRILDAIVLQLVLLCTLLGYRMVRQDDEGRLTEREIRLRSGAVSFRNVRGILSAFVNTAGYPRTLFAR